MLVLNLSRNFLNCIKLSNKNCLFKRCFKKQVDSFDNKVNLSYRSLIKPFIFTIGFCGCSYASAAVWKYESDKSKLIYNLKNNLWSKNHKTDKKVGKWRNKINEWWNSLSDGQKIFFAIAAINGVVFLAWKVPALQNFMIYYFSSVPLTKSLPCLPMLLSNFSHNNFMHLALNMFVLYSFTEVAMYDFGKEQFLALYLSSGVVSSFFSYAHKIVTRSYQISLGASGAILGILASSCTLHPDIKLMIVFLPFFSIPAGMALKGILLFDTAGVLLKWQFFDHAAHLGGALFGIWYSTYGQKLIWENKSALVKKWHEIRTKHK